MHFHPYLGTEGQSYLTLRNRGGPNRQDLEKASSSTWGSTGYFHFIHLIYLHLGVGILQTLRHQNKEVWVGRMCVYSGFVSRGKKTRCILVFRKKPPNQTALNRHESSGFARTFHQSTASVCASGTLQFLGHDWSSKLPFWLDTAWSSLPPSVMLLTAWQF